MSDPNQLAHRNADDGIVWIKVSAQEMDLYGTDQSVQDILTCRLPESVAEQCSPGVWNQCRFASGVRLRFGTDSPRILLRAMYGKFYESIYMNYFGLFGFDLYKCEPDGHEVFRHLYRPPADFDRKTLSNDPYTAKDPGMTFYTLNFPLYSEIRELYLGVEEGSAFTRGMPYRNEKPVIFYGSSITHGVAASRPGNIYQGFISQKYNLNYRNLGFPGNAKGEPAMAEYIAAQEMSAFVCDYDHNAPSPEHLRNTHYRFYEIIRAKHPEIPYLMVTRPNFYSNPELSSIRRAVIKESYQRAKDAGDQNVWFVDGETLLQGDFMEDCTMEGCHPNDIGFLRMGERIGSALFPFFKS